LEAHCDAILRATVVTSPVATLVVVSDGKILVFNRAAEKLTGYRASRFPDIEACCRELCPNPEYLQMVLRNVRRILQGKPPEQDEYVITRRDGEARHVRLAVSFFEGGFVTQLADVTDLRKTEATLRESEAQLRLLADAASEGIVISQDSRVVKCNDQAAHILGLERRDMIGKHVAAFTVPEDRENVMRRLRTGAQDTYEVRAVRKDGSTAVVEVHGRSLIINGKKSRIAAIYDITARKEVEEALRQSEARLRSLVGTMAEGVLLVGKDGKVLLANSAAERILGRKRSRLKTYDIDHPVPGALRPDGTPLPLNERVTWRAFREKRLVRGEGLGMRRPDGSVAWLDVVAVPLADDEGRPEGLVVTLADVTSRVEMERALRESEQNFRSLADNATEAILTESAEGELLYANRHAGKMLGYRPKELVGMNLHDLLAPAERERVAKFTRRRLAGKRVPRPYETVLVARDGTVVPVEVTGCKAMWRGRTVTIGMLRDIAERKMAERDLRASEATYRKTIDSLAEAVHVVDSNLRVLICNRFFKDWCRRLGLRGDIVGMTVPEAFPFLPRSVHQEYERVRETGQTLRSHERATIGGKEILTETLKIPIKEKDEVTRIITVVRDETEKRTLEREILDVSRREQRRIGQALHDSLGQELTGIAFLTKALEISLKMKSAPEADDAARIVALVKGSLVQTRSIARGISPVDMVAEGLGEALRQLARRTRDLYRISCQCQVRRACLVHDNEVATHVYYVAQEALHNAVRHGKAEHVVIHLSSAGDHGRLVVQDDGKGLPKSLTRSKGLGLKIMRYRAEMVGGSLQVANNDHGGVTVTCTFEDKPLPDNA